MKALIGYVLLTVASTKLPRHLDTEVSGFPRIRTVSIALISFAVFFVIEGLAIKYQNKAWLPTACVVATMLKMAIAAWKLADFQQERK